MTENGESSYRRFLDGDDSAFAHILELYRDNLTFFLCRYVHDLSLAEDLAADTFAELLLHPHRYNFSVSLKTYLFTIGKRRAIDHLRHSARVCPVPSEKMEILCGGTDESSDPVHIYLQSAEKEALYAAMERLKEDYRTALYLVYFEDLSYKEAARVMRKTPKQIENLVYRAKNALRTDLRKEW